MRKYIWFILLLLVSCSILVPPRIVVQDSPYPVEQVERAVIDFSTAWFEEFDEDIWWAVEDLDIQFYGKDEYVTGCVTGQTFNPGHIRVSFKKNNPQPLELTAIWHEMTHSVLWDVYKDPDANHSEPYGPWTTNHDELIRDMKNNFNKE